MVISCSLGRFLRSPLFKVPSSSTNDGAIGLVDYTIGETVGSKHEISAYYPKVRNSKSRKPNFFIVIGRCSIFHFPPKENVCYALVNPTRLRLQTYLQRETRPHFQPTNISRRMSVKGTRGL